MIHKKLPRICNPLTHLQRSYPIGQSHLGCETRKCLYGEKDFIKFYRTVQDLRTPVFLEQSSIKSTELFRIKYEIFSSFY